MKDQNKTQVIEIQIDRRKVYNNE